MRTKGQDEGLHQKNHRNAAERIRTSTNPYFYGDAIACARYFARVETISPLSELHAALFQALITAGLAGLTTALYARYRRQYLLWWSVAWTLYLARIGVISAFLVDGDPRLLSVHQVLTGWTALALLWSA